MNRLHEFDLDLCLMCNRISTSLPLERFFRAVSRLGDGVFWYSLMLVFPLLYGSAGALVTVHMLTAALPSLLLYKYLKRKTLRPRPCAVSPRVKQKTRALDQFSFPSGHTLHAVCFTVIICGHFAGIGWLLIPFTLLVALSRPVLGLHYPSDVLAGAAIGATIASLSRALPWFA
jgi:undecaprenyl-diphosphatase